MKIARILSLTAILTSALALPLARAADKPAATLDIVAVATGAGSFKTLVAALKAAGLVETLQGKGTANVVKPDIAASNGVIHVIDTVVLPK